MRPRLVPFATNLGDGVWVVEPAGWAMIVMGSTLADSGEPRQKSRYVVVTSEAK